MWLNGTGTVEVHPSARITGRRKSDSNVVAVGSLQPAGLLLAFWGTRVQSTVVAENDLVFICLSFYLETLNLQRCSQQNEMFTLPQM